MSPKKSTTRKKPEPFFKKSRQTRQPDTTVFELEIWPSRSFKRGPRSGNIGLGTYRSMHDVEMAVKRIEKIRKAQRKAAYEFRVYMLYTERTRIH